MRAHRAVAAIAVCVASAIAGRPALAAGPTPEAPPTSPPAATPIDPVKEAEAHFRRGVELYKESDLGGALVEFKRAYDLAPNFRVLFNLGQTYYQLQRYADALRTLQAFLTQGGAQISAERRASVQADVRQLENRVGQIDIRANVDGAQILVDDDAVGATPLAQAVAVSVGRRKISATKAGLPDQERFIDVAAGDHPTVVFEFPTAAPAMASRELPPPSAPTSPFAPAPASSVPSPAPAPEPSRTGTWIAWGVTGAFGAATAVTGVLALAGKSDLSHQLDTFPGNPGAIDDARTRTKTFGVLSDALLGATVVAGGVAVYVTLSGHHASSAEVGIGPSGVQLRGRY
jgi:hypothetical protein